VAIGYLSQKVRSITIGIIAGIAIAAVLSLLVALRAGKALFLDIMLPGMLLGAIVGFATQRWGRRTPAVTVR
jgi:gas vesicle protein